MIQASFIPHVKKSKPFPKLMIASAEEKSKTVIVLFECSGTGTIVFCSEGYPDKVGKCLTFWNMDTFEDFNEELIIQNI